jgi:hypothetical protein
MLCLQLDGGGVASGGLRELIPCIARTAVAVGVDGIFMEVWWSVKNDQFIIGMSRDYNSCCLVYPMHPFLKFVGIPKFIRRKGLKLIALVKNSWLARRLLVVMSVLVSLIIYIQWYLKASFWCLGAWRSSKCPSGWSNSMGEFYMHGPWQTP